MNQALRIVYNLSQRVELQPSPRSRMKFSVTVGRRGIFDCENCDDSLKVERGFCPFLSEQAPSTRPVLISDTGDQARDELRCCPKGVQLRNPGLAETLRSFFAIKAASVPGYYGSQGLVNLPPRIAATYAELNGIEAQFEHEIAATRRSMDREA